MSAEVVLPAARRAPRAVSVAAAAPATRLRQLCLAVWMLLFSLVGYYLISRFVVTAVVVQGRSMMPTLQDGERYFLNRLAFHYRNPARGDVVVVSDPGHSDHAVKRIVGMPGEMVSLKDGAVLVNRQPLQEPYLFPGTRTFAPEREDNLVKLHRDQYFILGDNRPCSEDSRVYGPVSRAQIIGLISK